MILIIGYGNPLRSDDAIGQHVAQAMQQLLISREVEVLTVYQLTPELVSSISEAQLVIFIDARIGDHPGEVIHEIIEPVDSITSLTHYVAPALLLEASRELYHKAPKGILISIVGGEFDYGCELSPKLSRILPSITVQVQAIIESSVDTEPYKDINHA